MNTQAQVPLLLIIATCCLMKVTSADPVSNCRHEIVESMPDKLHFNTTLRFKVRPTHDSLIEMIDNAQKTLRIASFYWTLSAEGEFANDPTAMPGKQIMDAVEKAAVRGVNIQIVLDKSGKKNMNNENDIKRLNKIADVRYLNMSQLLKSGVLHSKFLIADGETFYVGSSNFDWRSYLQIKEIGISFTKCPELTLDMDKIFRTYILMSELGKVPDTLPDNLKTEINVDNPLRMKLDDLNAKIFLGAAPPAFNGVKTWSGRTDDIDGLLHILDKARHRVDISVMNYSPRTEFIWPKKFWPRIDNALRRAAADRHVQVRLLFSNWTQNKEEEIMWYRSLNDVQSEALRGGGIHVKMFKVPAYDPFQKSIPFARVKHDKYMVTDRGLYIGTSNWAADYFISTCGVGVVIEPEEKSGAMIKGVSVIKNMQDLFDRDFNSEFAHELPPA